MKRSILLIGLAILVSSTMFILGTKDSSSKSTEVELKALRTQIASLEERVKKLEDQLHLSKLLKDYSVTIPQTFPKMPQVPKEWQKRKFNGIPYYVIPLQQMPNKSPEVNRDNERP